MSSISKLSTYNEALGHLKQRTLSALTDNQESRRVLDSFWDGNLEYCLARGYWNFAMRAVSIANSDSITPQFGYAYAFEKPDDFVRLYEMADNPYFRPQIWRMNDEAGLWYAEVTPLYVRYVSNGESFGLNMSNWTQPFADYVGRRLAWVSAKRIANPSAAEIDQLEKEADKSKAIALSTDAMDENPIMPPRGTWASSRQRYYNGPRSQTLGY